MNTEKKTNRKEWVKNVAIIFLSVMLVLTFFSNTIMNYSLPEVATAMIEPGSITAKIRGTGNLTSDDPYKITIQESRKIKSVAVKQGDVVEKDQVLFYLEDEDSTELEEAEKALDELILAYSSSILKGDISNEAYENIQGGKVSSNNDYQARITAAKDKVDAAEATVASLEKQIAIMEASSGSSIDNQKALDAANAELSKAKENLASLQLKMENSQPQTEKNVVTLTTDKHTAGDAYEAAKQAFDKEDADGVRNKLKTAVEYANNTLSTEQMLQNTVSKKYDEITNINEYMAVLSKLYESVPSTQGEVRQSLLNAMREYQQAYEVVFAAKVEYDNVSKLLDSVINYDAQKAALQASINSANNYVNECQAKVNALQNQMSNNKAENDKQKESLSLQKIEAGNVLKQAQEELTQLLTDISSELNLGNQNSIIREQREKIAKLRENAVGATITAPIAGTVTSVGVIAGETTDPTKELAVMQPEGKGFSMSFAVTPEQAKKVKVGEQAEIQNSWYYNDITATLVGIRPDPESNGSKKLLVFDVAGDVQAGQSVSLSIGQRSANYDLLVPNSAVREDNNGKFILLVEAKNSPLGNRYIATRVDVEVLGSDDNKTAISAPLYGYEYVITTSTQPVEAGKQVRLAEN